MTRHAKHDADYTHQDLRDFVEELRKFVSGAPRGEGKEPAPRHAPHLPTEFTLDGHASVTITTLGCHGLSEGDKIVFTTTGSLPKGLQKPLWKRALDKVGLKTKDRVFTVGKVHRG